MRAARLLVAFAASCLLAQGAAAQSPTLAQGHPRGSATPPAASTTYQESAPSWVGEAPWEGEVVSEYGYGEPVAGYPGAYPGDWGMGYGCDVVCGPHLTVQGEALAWWVQSMTVPKLVTTSPSATARESAGVLGAGFIDTAFTTTLFGGGLADEESFAAGGRATLSWWTDSDETLGIKGNFFALGDADFEYTATSGGTPILARPFFNVAPATGDPRQAASLLAYPGLLAGSINVRGRTELMGGEAYLQENWYQWGPHRIDVNYGYRTLRLDELLQIDDGLEFLQDDGFVLQGTTIVSRDEFETRNIFHGGQFGVVWTKDHGRWQWDGAFKLALGNIEQRAKIAGQSTTTVPGGGSATSAGGLLALPTNIGTYSRDRFGTLLDARLGLAWHWTPRAKLSLAYNLIYLNRTLRPGDQISLNVNDTQTGGGTLTGTGAPLFAFNETDFWAQGISFGLEYRR